jgi:DNA-binding transcriptional regulator YdaS (Cro superfamily)
MTLDEIIARAGDADLLAAIIGVHRATVHGYRHTEKQLIPAHHARKVAKALGIPLHEIRPDIWPPRAKAGRAHDLVTA